MRIVILDAFASNPGDVSWAELEQFGELTVYDRTAPEETLDRIADADIVLLNKAPLRAEVLRQCPKLKLISVLATGYNIVDIAAARELGITVCNVPGYSTGAVAQMTFALLLELTQHVGLHSAAVHAGQWQNSPDFCFWNAPLTELAGKTMGLIGYGAIGQAVATIAKAFGMELLVTSRTPKNIDGFVNLQELLERSDIVSLHCPQTTENLHMLNAETIAQMKDGALLINTARGGLVDEQAVADALVSGKLGGYAADVVSKEPICASNPLLTAPNCVLSPHVAWAPKETRLRLHSITAENIRKYLAGQPQNVVNAN